MTRVSVWASIARSPRNAIFILKCILTKIFLSASNSVSAALAYDERIKLKRQRVCTSFRINWGSLCNTHSLLVCIKWQSRVHEEADESVIKTSSSISPIAIANHCVASGKKIRQFRESLLFHLLAWKYVDMRAKIMYSCTYMRIRGENRFQFWGGLENLFSRGPNDFFKSRSNVNLVGVLSGSMIYSIG